MGNFISNIGNTLANNTAIGRMVTKGENFMEAHVNASKENLEGIGEFVSDHTIPGRMATKGENILEAHVNT